MLQNRHDISFAITSPFVHVRMTMNSAVEVIVTAISSDTL